MRTIRLSWPSEAETGSVAGSVAGSVVDSQAEVFLDPGQARHGVVVLRLAPGAQVEMVGPLGLAKAIITTVSQGHPPGLGVKLTGPWSAGVGNDASAGGVVENSVKVALALSLIQPGRFDWAVEKAVELGAGSLIPLICARTKPGLARFSPSRASRWERLSEEARKQCGRHQPFHISPPTTLSELVLTWEGPKIFLHPYAPLKLPNSIFNVDSVEPSGAAESSGLASSQGVTQD